MNFKCTVNDTTARYTFSSNHNIHKSSCGLCLLASDFSEDYQLKCLKPKNKGHMNFYECCDLTKKVYIEPIPYCNHLRN